MNWNSAPLNFNHYGNRRQMRVSRQATEVTKVWKDIQHDRMIEAINKIKKAG